MLFHLWKFIQRRTSLDFYYSSVSVSTYSITVSVFSFFASLSACNGISTPFFGCLIPTSTILVPSTMAAYPIATFHLADERLCYCLYLALRFWMVISVTDVVWQVFVSLSGFYNPQEWRKSWLIKVSIVHWLATLWERKWILGTL